MIKTMWHNTRTGEARWGDEGLFSEWNAIPDLWIWADFDNTDPQYKKQLFVEIFKLHPLAIADAQRESHPPKLEVFDGFFFLMIRELDTTTTDIDFHAIQIAFFVSESFLVTRRNLESVSINAAWNDAENE